MDEEDLADAEEARKIQTSHSFSGLGLTADDVSRPSAGNGGALAGLFSMTGETKGKTLLKKMGWKEGQGIGPKVRRSARLDVGRPEDRQKTFLFAPEDVMVMRLVKKTDHKGLGFQGEGRLTSLTASRRGGSNNSDDDDNSDSNAEENGITRGLFSRSKFLAGKSKSKPVRMGGIGIGVLNDTGSDDEDPYDMGPRISFNRVIGGDKKKKKKRKATGRGADRGANDDDNDNDDDDGGGGGARSAVAKPKLVFSSLRSSASRVCHDGRPPLEGFVLGKKADALTSDVNASAKYPPPVIPPDWKSSKQPRGGRVGAGQPADSAYLSTADVAKASKLDPKSRAAVLGERQLPGKSVFDFLSRDARERIAAATGRNDLPEARGEVPAAYALTEQEKRDQLLQAVPSLDKATAVAAITRGARGGGPYQDNEAKRSRYRAYLEYQAGIIPSLPPKPAGMKDDDWLREAHEFFNCARIFKPMSGLMASRFTTSTASTAKSLSSASGAAGDGDKAANLVTRPAPKQQDPAEEAAKMGMYGQMTRTVSDFIPSRLLCKRMGVKPPDIVQHNTDLGGMSQGYGGTGSSSSSWSTRPTYGGSNSYSPAAQPLTAMAAMTAMPAGPASAEAAAADVVPPPAPASAPAVAIQPDRNEALEGKRASEDVFRAVFGDSDDDDDE